MTNLALLPSQNLINNIKFNNMENLSENNGGNCANRVLAPVKTLKSFIKLCDRISNLNRDKMKGIKNARQYTLIGIIRESVQNELQQLKELLP